MNATQARIAATLAAVAATAGAAWQPLTAQTNKPAQPAGGPSRRAATPSSDCTTTGTWRTRSSMTVPAAFAGTVVAPDGRVFVISGVTAESVGPLTDAVRVYDPTTDRWAAVSPIPTPRTEPGAAVGPDGKIYVVGGADRGHKKNVVEAYDPKNDRWARLKPMPTPREALWAAAARGADGRVRIYAIGGRDRSKPGNGLSIVEAYDPVTDTWAAMAPMPTHRHALVATLGPDGRIYALGGTNDTVASTDAVEIYDPVKNSWARGTPMPYGQECAAATSTSGPDGEILVFAGWDARKRPIPRAVAYNPRTHQWRSLPPMSTARAAGGAVTIAGADGCIHVYVLGGSPHEAAVEEYSFRAASRGP
jgi:N-acetylneuraminic acid mutarotase